jgi:hypothetical protein
MVVVLCNPGQSVSDSLLIVFTRVALGNTSFIKLAIASIKALRSKRCLGDFTTHSDPLIIWVWWGLLYLSLNASLMYCFLGGEEGVMIF